MYSLAGKVALVTGAARKRGIGCGIALRLAKEGADIVVNDILRAPEELDPWDKEAGWLGLDSIVKEAKSLGRKALAIRADVSNSREVDDIFKKVMSEFGRIDILVNNAGLLTRELGNTPVVELSEEIWNRGVAVNLGSVFLMSRAAARQMIKQGQRGKIISISSRHGKLAHPKHAIYSTTKGGIISFTQALALELGQYKINVNAVCPGPTVSWSTHGTAIYAAMKKGIPEEEAIRLAYTDASGKFDGGPMGGLVQVEDVANVVAFLASDQSNYMTGQAVNITGGRTLMR